MGPEYTMMLLQKELLPKRQYILHGMTGCADADGSAVQESSALKSILEQLTREVKLNNTKTLRHQAICYTLSP